MPGTPEHDGILRKVGVEEELLLVDPATGALRAVSAQVVRGGEPPALEQELFLQQVETATPPCRDMAELEDEIRACRRTVGKAAEDAGVAAVAVATPVLAGVDEVPTRVDRYERIYQEYGEIAREALVCAMHVHVDVSDDAEAVAVVDGLRPWLPVLIAISANSPYWRGSDTGFASWRTETWGRWPSARFTGPFGSVEAYRERSRTLIEWGVALDPGMLYYDARLAAELPTVEIRVADVCTEIEDAVLVATLARALVSRVAAADDDATAAWHGDLLTAAKWRAARFGLAGELVHPGEQRLAPVRDVLDALLQYVEQPLTDTGDLDRVRTALDRLLSRGTGATRQRATFESKGTLEAVVDDLCERTRASWAT